MTGATVKTVIGLSKKCNTTSCKITPIWVKYQNFPHAV